MWKDEIIRKRSFTRLYSRNEKREAIKEVMDSLEETIKIAEKNNEQMKLMILQSLTSARFELQKRYDTIQGDRPYQ
jgi:hypothetical protein